MDNTLIKNLSSRGEKLFYQNISISEEILVKIKGSFGEGLVVTDKRIYILKWGFMTGNILSGGCNAYEFPNVTSVDIKKSILTGTFEIQTPANQNVKKSYWGLGEKNAPHAENIISFQNNQYKDFQQAANICRELIIKHHNKENINLSHTSNLDELEKLADLKKKGIITEKEFQAKKKQILGL